MITYSTVGLGSGAAHHPTRAFHMLRGEAIAWLYTLAALDAVYMLETDLKTATPIELSSRYLKKLDVLQVRYDNFIIFHNFHS
jgi:hypothetical protein